MKNKLGQLLATALGVLLLIYSASRSLDFVEMTLPADKQILAYFALAALDGGILAWLLSHLYGSNGSWQRAISLIMIIVDFIGAVAVFTADTLYNTGKAGLTTTLDPGTINTIVLALSGVIAMNIAATIAHHLLDPETQKRAAEEEARAQIEDEALELIQQNSKQLAKELAPQIASTWKTDMANEYSHRLKKPKALPATTEPNLSETVGMANPTTPPKQDSQRR